MATFDHRSDTQQQVWTYEDVAVFSTLDTQYIPGITALLQFLIRDEGVIIDETVDLTIVLNSVVNTSGVNYSFDQTESILTLAAEFCLIDTAYEKQTLCGIELLDNSVLFLALIGEVDYAIDAAVCLSRSSRSMMYKHHLLPSLCLFGHWEPLAATMVAAILSFGSTSCRVNDLYKAILKSPVGDISEIEFLSDIQKLCAVHLLKLSKRDDDIPVVSVNIPAAGLFLMFSDRIEVARRLALLSA